MGKRALLVVLLIFTLLTAPGCWNRRDPEMLAIVLAMAFDYDREKEMYLLIVQVANPQAMASDEGGGGGGGKRSFWVVSSYGHTPFDAMRNMGVATTRKMLWAHNRIVLFSEEAARHGIGEIMDVFERERQMRVTALSAVVLGDIRKIMEADFPLEETGALGLDRQMQTIHLDQSVFPTKSLNELYSTFEAPGIEVFLGKIEVQADDGDGPPGGNGGGGEGGGNGGGGAHPRPPAIIGGAGLFKGDRLVGWATPDQAHGWLLAVGEGRRHSFVAQCPGDPKKFFSAELFETAAEMIPLVEGGEPRVVLKVEATGRLQNYPCGGDLVADSELIRSLERRVSQAVRNRIKDMIERAQELEADVMGFGNLFYRKRPAYWKENGERWDEIFLTLAVDVQVKIELMRSGMIEEPMKIR